MQRTLLIALAIPLLAGAAVGSSTAATSTNAYSGHVCSLVSTSASRSAGIHARCIEKEVVGAAVATWGAPGSSHYLAVRVGPLAVPRPLTNNLQPRTPRWLGPIPIAPGINAYYTLSTYDGKAKRAGTMRFAAKANLITISLTNATSSAVPGLTTVAKSVERQL